MQHISELLQQYKPEKKEKVLYPRQELIKKFVDRLNLDRGNGRKKLSPAFIASKMYNAGLKTDFLLNWFYGYLNDSANFSAFWWWSLDAKNAKK